MNPIAVTMGDAAGIGPEIVVKTFADEGFISDHPSFVVGDLGVLRRQAAALAPQLVVRPIGSVADYRQASNRIDVLPVSELPTDLEAGQIDARAGQAAFDAIRRATQLAMNREVGGICTAPINKEALAAAGVPYPGHTEMLADFSGVEDYAMMLMNPSLKTILVTVHCSLAEAIRRISTALELRIIRLAYRTLRDFGIEHPRVAVAGLNPHAGEAGLFGREDIDLILPAIAQAKAEGISVTGPHPGDTVFMNARRGRFDIVVAQYHDQGLIPIKLMGVEDGVNVTVGLPFVRTSPDHGTAFDISGQGSADPSSMKTALAAAHQLARARSGRSVTS